MREKVEIIAEIGQAHDGSLGILHSYIDAVAKTGVDTVKFQTHIAEAESSQSEPFRVNFSYEDKTRYDYWRRMEFSVDQWIGIKKHCEEVGLKFLSSPFSLAAVDLLEDIGVNRYKIGSGEVTNLLILERLAQTGKPVLISSGMSSFEEIEKAVSIFGHDQVSIMECTTQYPTVPENIGLNVISEFRQRFNLPIGFSDHSGEIFPSLAAVALGADIIEIHVVFNKQMFGPDVVASLTVGQLEELVRGIRFLEISLAHPKDKNDLAAFDQLKNIFEKSLAVNKDLSHGHVLRFEDLETKKPANMGVNARDYKSLLGKKLTRPLEKWDFIKPEDIQ